MPVNHAKEFLMYVLYFHTFLSELQMAPIMFFILIGLAQTVPAKTVFKIEAEPAHFPTACLHYVLILFRNSELIIGNWSGHLGWYTYLHMQTIHK